jgi:hypothetical protein
VTGLLADLRSKGLSPNRAVAELKRRSIKAAEVGRILESPQATADS